MGQLMEPDSVPDSRSQAGETKTFASVAVGEIGSLAGTLARIWAIKPGGFLSQIRIRGCKRRKKEAGLQRGAAHTQGNKRTYHTTSNAGENYDSPSDFGRLDNYQSATPQEIRIGLLGKLETPVKVRPNVSSRPRRCVGGLAPCLLSITWLSR